jgi:hypothetical protein
MNITLDDIVRNYMITQGKNTLHGYVKMMKHLVDFLRDFSMDNAYMDNIAILELDEKNAVQFPEGLISIKMAAWQSGDRIIKFETDNRINLNSSRKEDVGSATPNVAYNISQTWPYNGIGSIADSVNLPQTTSLGIGHNGLGYLRVNWAEREIQFDANVPAPTEIYLEYKSNGFNPKSKSSIPEFASKVAEEYIHWQLGRAKHGDASAEVMARRMNYKREYDIMLARLDPIDYEGIVGARARSFDINKILH